MHKKILKILKIVSLTAESSFNKDYGIRFLGVPYGGTCLPKDVPEMRSLTKNTKCYDFANAVHIINEYTRKINKCNSN